MTTPVPISGSTNVAGRMGISWPVIWLSTFLPISDLPGTFSISLTTNIWFFSFSMVASVTSHSSSFTLARM